MIEIWKPITYRLEEWECCGYEISNLGRVKGPKGNIIQPFIASTNGVYHIRFYVDGQMITAGVHRLVAHEFIRKLDSKCIVKFKDGNVLNPELDNLLVYSRFEHLQIYGMNRKLGEKVVLKNIETGEIIEFDNPNDCKAKTGICLPSISKLKHGKQKRAWGYMAVE